MNKCCCTGKGFSLCHTRLCTFSRLFTFAVFSRTISPNLFIIESSPPRLYHACLHSLKFSCDFMCAFFSVLFHLCNHLLMHFCLSGLLVHLVLSRDLLNCPPLSIFSGFPTDVFRFFLAVLCDSRFIVCKNSIWPLKSADRCGSIEKVAIVDNFFRMKFCATFIDSSFFYTHNDFLTQNFSANICTFSKPCSLFLLGSYPGLLVSPGAP